MEPDPSFEQLKRGLEAGEPEAARRCFEQFARRLVGLAHSRLGPQLRAKVDAEDIVQSVFNSFFTRQAEGEFEFQDWNGLWGMLVVITLRKCGRRVEYFRAARRDVRREVSPAAGPDDSGPVWEAVNREPTPDEAAALAELVEKVVSPLKEDERQVVLLRLQGYTVPEVAERIGRTERTVQRILERVRSRLEHWTEE